MILNAVVAGVSAMIITIISYLDLSDEDQSKMVFLKNLVMAFVIIFGGSLFLGSLAGKDIGSFPVDGTIL